MTVRRPPTPKTAPFREEESLDPRTEAFINKGMQAQTAERKEPAKPVKVLLVIPAPNQARIEAVLAKRKVRISRHTWLLEAIVEKLEREENDAKGNSDVGHTR
jgi:hypothetical protein